MQVTQYYFYYGNPPGLKSAGTWGRGPVSRVCRRGNTVRYLYTRLEDVLSSALQPTALANRCDTQEERRQDEKDEQVLPNLPAGFQGPNGAIAEAYYLHEMTNKVILLRFLISPIPQLCSKQKWVTRKECGSCSLLCPSRSDSSSAATHRRSTRKIQ
ncbi:hypothetical protein COCMIDRAFT_22462 [Bipolaris oryzae ATCC 44560]|uniref:Uncharacterized protein n=1 Tax=Bipolaris oryzae ATCC 44560 TaxID=930090 RepID=W6ZIT1_COCMI|nr:uncharacterized protein COCMIDRAFT_22462 [Bipolaris oryzae ATCC 44560]EUC49900.1 hypothetical protein COCMIDRAFT_22462 [Bipolaris oryzae ATCC 44560]